MYTVNHGPSKTSIEFASNASTLVCGHSFHSECISEWINHNPESPTCPQCRRGSTAHAAHLHLGKIDIETREQQPQHNLPPARSPSPPRQAPMPTKKPSPPMNVPPPLRNPMSPPRNPTPPARHLSPLRHAQAYRARSPSRYVPPPPGSSTPRPSRTSVTSHNTHQRHGPSHASDPGTEHNYPMFADGWHICHVHNEQN
ncbi:hypothetical protein LPJ74_002584 [Coemansia sp. RSA 1843]|nr:hypothetical protein LPJ74_002584 [Coemansia sp. RSA 1843]